MDTTILTDTPAQRTGESPSDATSFPALQHSELLRLQQENARLRLRLSTLEHNLAELRGMVHEFLTVTDPV